MSNKISFRGELTKVSSFASKGGGVQLTIQIPFNTEENMDASDLIKHANKVCRGELDMSDGQADLFPDEEADG